MSSFKFDPATTALIVIDVQKAFDEMVQAGAKRNNSDAELNIAAVLAAFRTAGGHIVHIRHSNVNPASRFNPQSSGFAVRDEARERHGEPVLFKSVNSAFIGTDLDERLRAASIISTVIVGATTNHCVETTTRMSGNLGYQTFLVDDATWTFDRDGLDGRTYAAADIHAMSLSNLNEEFCQVVATGDIIAAIKNPA